MKKKLSLVLALVLSLSLAACGGKTAPTAETQKAADNDVNYVKNKGNLVVGITDFKPMDYQENGEWIGFDADMAKAFAESLGVKCEFIEINWDNKAMELETKAIDAVWNGMTLTTEVKELMGTSNAYCNNGQVVVVNKAVADKYQSAGQSWWPLPPEVER